MAKLPSRTFKKKFDAQHGRCFYCGEDLVYTPIEIDHIIPFSVSHDGSVANLCLCCKRCNRLKADNTLDNFKRALGTDQLIRGLFYYEFIKLPVNG